MFGLAASTFRRYLAAHVALERRGFPILDIDGHRIGHVDEIAIRRGRLHVAGWALADSAELASAFSRVRVPIDQIRADVTQAIGASESARVGFRLDVLYAHAASRLIIQDGDRFYIHPIEPFSWRRQRVAVVLAALGFAGASLRLLPALWRFGTTGSREALLEIKAGLGLLESGGAEPLPVLDERLLPGASDEAPIVPHRKTTIVIPIHNGFDLLPELLRRVRANTDAPYRLVLVEDRSTDPRVRPFLRDWVARHAQDVTLIENEENLGFIGSVNRAFETALGHGGNVVLLNSDALVPKGWLSRLVAPLHAEDRVASVTPMSNDAEILSVPAICRPAPLAPGQGDLIDAVAARLPARAALRDLPTGIGFCMALNRDYLASLPCFDTAFGRGYGEEVDWCRKVMRLGGRHLAAPNLFVEHRGGASFGSADKSELLRRNGRIITARYPEYDLEVQRFISSDPLATPRLALALAHAASATSAPVDIFLGHAIGGGADRYLGRCIEDAVAEGRPAVVLRVGGGADWVLELHGEHGRLAVATTDFAALETLLEPLRARRVVYSCAVGARDPLAVAAAIRSLAGVEGATLEALFHDYYLLTPSYCLLDGDGVHRGVPPAESEDPAHRHGVGEGAISLRTWRQVWGGLLARADRLVVFSQDSRRQVLAAYPDLAARIEVRPHTLLQPVPPAARRPLAGRRAVIGVLGNIGLQKGARVVAEMSRRIAGRTDLGLVVIGNLDLLYQPHPSMTIHGDYEVPDIPRLVESYGIDAWLIPSVWPETFSYTMHEALATGLPVFCFDLGAQAEAARAAPNGFVLDTAMQDATAPGRVPPEDAILRVLREQDRDGGAGTRRDGDEDVGVPDAAVPAGRAASRRALR